MHFTIQNSPLDTLYKEYIIGINIPILIKICLKCSVERGRKEFPGGGRRLKLRSAFLVEYMQEGLTYRLECFGIDIFHSIAGCMPVIKK